MVMRQNFLAYNQPDIGDDEIRAVTQVLRSGWLTRGPLTQQFEETLQDLLEVPYVVAVSSCTAALHLALVIHNVGPGDEVITTPMTFVASINAILETGATPVLVDINPVTGNINLDAAEDVITEKTRAILPVHYGGLPVDMTALTGLGGRYGLAIIEDAAHALGSRYEGKPIGSFGHAACFSFYPTKNITTGEGGALSLSDPDMAQKARTMSLHGLSHHAWNRYGHGGAWAYDVTMLGFKYNMTDIQAALGLAQLARLGDMQKKRRTLALRYREKLSKLPLKLPTEPAFSDHSWHLYAARLDRDKTGAHRDRIVQELARHGIGTSVHFIPVYRFSYYRDRFGWRPEDFPMTEAFYETELSLPLYPSMTIHDVDDVAQALAACLAGS